MKKVFLLILLSSLTGYSHAGCFMQQGLQVESKDETEVTKKGSFSVQIKEVQTQLAALAVIGRNNDKYDTTQVTTWLERITRVQGMYTHTLQQGDDVKQVEGFLPAILTNARNARLILALKEEESREEEKKMLEDGTCVVVPTLQSRRHRSGNCYTPDDYTRG